MRIMLGLLNTVQRESEKLNPSVYTIARIDEFQHLIDDCIIKEAHNLEDAQKYIGNIFQMYLIHSIQ